MILTGDSLTQLRTLPDQSVHCCVTSPPYFGLRDYGSDGQIGLERTPTEYIVRLVEVFREVRRVLRDDATFWLNLGDSYAGSWGAQSREHAGKHAPNISAISANQVKAAARRESRTGSIPPGSGLKPKDLMGIPWRVAFALQADGWYLRSDIIWAKPNAMTESVTDRPSKAHEYMFLLTKSRRYFYDQVAVAEKSKSETETRNLRTVWSIPVGRYAKAHFATFPPKLVRPCIFAGTSAKGCCPQCGAPWQRITNKVRRATRPGRETKVTGDSLTDGNRDPQRHVTSVETLGWKQSCKCPRHEPIPCTVLDPFAGSGTTLAVAKQHGRSYVGIELNPEYVRLIEKRLESTSVERSLFDDLH